MGGIQTRSDFIKFMKMDFTPMPLPRTDFQLRWKKEKTNANIVQTQYWLFTCYAQEETYF